MAGFLGALGSVAANYAKDRMMNRYRRSGVQGAVDRYRHSGPQDMAASPSMASPDEQPTVDPTPIDERNPRDVMRGIAEGTNNDEYGPAGLPMDSFGQGKIVMKPTIARLAEHGQAEMVIPLNGRGDNKVDGLMALQSPRSRYRPQMR